MFFDIRISKSSVSRRKIEHSFPILRWYTSRFQIHAILKSQSLCFDAISRDFGVHLSRSDENSHPQCNRLNHMASKPKPSLTVLSPINFSQVQNPFFPLPASSMPSPTFLAPLSTPFPTASKASPTGFPALPVTPVTVCPTPRPAAPTMPPAVLATPDTPFPKVEVTKPTGLLLLFEVGISSGLASRKRLLELEVSTMDEICGFWVELVDINGLRCATVEMNRKVGSVACSCRIRLAPDPWIEE